MTLAGWVFMGFSWGVIIGLFTFALVRTLTAKTQKTEDRSRKTEDKTADCEEIKKSTKS